LPQRAVLLRAGICYIGGGIGTLTSLASTPRISGSVGRKWPALAPPASTATRFLRMLAVSGFPRESWKLLEIVVSLKLRLVNAGAKRWMCEACECVCPSGSQSTRSSQSLRAATSTSYPHAVQMPSYYYYYYCYYYYYHYYYAVHMLSMDAVRVLPASFLCGVRFSSTLHRPFALTAFHMFMRRRVLCRRAFGDYNIYCEISIISSQTRLSLEFNVRLIGVS
jgi:hypothetical protein